MTEEEIREAAMELYLSLRIKATIHHDRWVLPLNMVLAFIWGMISAAIFEGIWIILTSALIGTTVILMITFSIRRKMIRRTIRKWLDELAKKAEEAARNKDSAIA